MATPCSPRPRPSCLAATASTVESPPIAPADVESVWAYVAPFVRQLAVMALRRVPLRQARHLASRGGEFLAVIDDQRGVHGALVENEVDDLVQDVAVAFVNAVQRGKVRASEPSLRDWLATTTWRVGVRTSRTKAALIFGAGESTLGADGGAAAADGPHAARARERAQDELVSDAEVLRRVSEVGRQLSENQRRALQGYADGLAPAEIAERLGATVATVRVWAFRALQIVRRALGVSPNVSPKRPKRAARRGKRGTRRSRATKSPDGPGPPGRRCRRATRRLCGPGRQTMRRLRGGTRRRESVAAALQAAAESSY